MLRVQVKPAAVFTHALRGALMGTSLGNELLAAGLSMDMSTADDWATSDVWAQYDSKVIALALVRPQGIHTFMHMYKSMEVDVRDFWTTTNATVSELFRLEIVDVVALSSPQHVFASTSISGFARGDVFALSQFSFQSCMSNTPGIANKILEWQLAFNKNFLDNADAIHDRVLVLPMPFAILTLKKALKIWAFPIRTATAKLRPGMLLLHSLWKDYDDCQLVDLSHIQYDDLFLQTADSLRVLRSWLVNNTLPTNQEELVELVTWQIQYYDQERIARLRRERGIMTRKYHIYCLLRYVIAAGYLRISSNLRVVVQEVLHAAVEDGSSSLLSEMINFEHAVPSAYTLLTHRITVHGAYCLWVREVVHNLMRGCHVTRWATVDSSPQGGYDWILWGHIVMRNDNLQDSLKLSHRLAQIASSDDHRLEEISIVATLADRLRRISGVPTAVASGRSGLRYKMKSMFHSMSLTSPSWLATARLSNSTFACTGDMGTESGVSRVRSKLTEIFGNWIILGDQGEQGDPGEQWEQEEHEEQGEQEFDVFDMAPEDPNAVVFDMAPEEAGEHVADAPPVAPPEPPLACADAPMPEEPLDVDLTKSFYVSGVLHVIHNCTKNFQDVLPGFKEFHTELKAVCRLLCAKPLRRRLLRTCFNEAPLSRFNNAFDSFSQEPHDGRWGSVLAACSELLPLMDILRAGWSLNKFGRLRGDDDANDESGNPKGVKVETVDRAIGSNAFWAYCKMIDLIGECLTEIANWSESCPCHSHVLQLRGHTRHKRRKQLVAFINRAACPMSCMRAPEAAAGMLQQLAEQIMDMGMANILLDPLMLVLTEEQRSLVLRAFAAARRHVKYIAVMKFAFWRRLPWVLAGIAHHDRDIAVACAARAVDLFAQGLDEGRKHWISQVLCTPGELGHTQLQLFLNGTDLFELPFLARMAARFRFVLISERWVESLHALNSRYLTYGPNCGVRHLVFHNMLLPLQRALAENPDVFTKFAEYGRQTRNIAGAAAALGFWHHPGIVRLRSNYQSKNMISNLQRKHYSEVVKILYHTDIESMYQPVPSVVDGDDNDGGQPPACDSEDFVVAGSLHDELWGKHAVELLKGSLDKNDGGGDRVVISLPVSRPGMLDGNRAFPTLSAVVNPTPVPLQPMIRYSKKTQQLPSPVQFDFELEDGSPSHTGFAEAVADSDASEAVIETGSLFFVVQQANPGQAKLVHGAHHAPVTSLMLSQLSLLHQGPGESLTVALESADGKSSGEPLVLSSSMLCAQDSGNIKMWKASKRLKYTFAKLQLASEHEKAFQKVMSMMFNGMASATALTSTAQEVHLLPSSDPDRSLHRCLECLKGHGFVNKASDGGLGTKWFFTRQGRAHIQVGYDISSPHELFSSQGIANLDSMNVLELHHKMVSEGWVLQQKLSLKQSRVLQKDLGLAEGSVDGSKQPYRVGEEKRWWLAPTQKTLSTSYMLALLKAGEHQRPVEHLRPNLYYVALLEGKEYKPQVRGPKVAFEFGSESHSAPSDEPLAEMVLDALSDGSENKEPEVSDVDSDEEDEQEESTVLANNPADAAKCPF